MRELAEQFVDDGIFGEIPERLESYIDYDRIARDLEHDYGSTTVAGEFLLYQCA
jgi:antirestriction protein